MNTSSKTRLLVEGAMMIALATVLSYIKIVEMPFGGSITLEMIPLIVMAYRNGTKWGVLTAFTHSVLQMILGFSNVMYCPTLLSQAGCILLDYLLAFSALGLAAFFGKMVKNYMGSIVFGSVVVCVLRFICSFLSGWLLWGAYAPEGMSAPYYSLVYNGAYMLPDTIIVVVVMVILAKVNKKILSPQEA